jgi:hypothetical protein
MRCKLDGEHGMLLGMTSADRPLTIRDTHNHFKSTGEVV